VYRIAGPLLAGPSESGCYLLAPAARDDFVARVYGGAATLAEIRALLGEAALARGALAEDGERLAVGDQVPALPLVEAWRGVARPVLPYVPELEGVLLEDGLLRLTPDAYRAIQAQAEVFQTGWVCEECGDPEDAAVVLWTAREGGRVRVCFVAEIEHGVWRCRLHPFDLAGEGSGLGRD
jgi:hypothetical protein